MTMDEIRALLDALLADAWEAQLSGRAFGESKSVAAARAALLRAVEGIVGTFATETKERERCRYGWANERARAEAAEKERDEAEQKLAQSEDRVIAIGTDLARSESALAAMREAHPDAMREAARIAWAFCHEAQQRLIADDDFRTRAAVAFSMLDRALASPPPAALSTETEVKPRTCDADGCPNPASRVVQVAPGCEYHLCGQCYGKTPDGQEDPTKSKEDHR